jgi:hypothetical protein
MSFRLTHQQVPAHNAPLYEHVLGAPHISRIPRDTGQEPFLSLDLSRHFHFACIMNLAIELEQSVQAILNNVVSSPQGAVGLVFAAIDKNGRILVNEAAGLKSLAKGDKVKLAYVASPQDVPSRLGKTFD